MKVLVTGGAGYIGSHMVEMLIENDYEVVVFDSLATGHRQAVHPQAAFYQGDLLDRAALAHMFAEHQFDGIFHFASYIIVPESMEKPFKYLRDNVVAAANLLEIAAEHGVKRFIFSSTAALFAEPTRMPIPADEPIIPGSPYGESKFFIERLLHWMDRIYGMKYCALRYFNAAGAHPNGHIGEAHDPESHLIPIVLQVALSQRDHVMVYGQDYATPDGTPIRDYIHILDLASAHILAFEALEHGESRQYNLGNGRGYSVNEIIEVARTITGHPIPVQYGERRAGDLPILIADSTRIQQELGWQPEFAQLHQIIETAWQWHKQHAHGYADA